MTKSTRTPTVCHLALAFLIFAKKHKNSSPTVWQLALAILGSWQIPAEPAHICARPRRLASDVSREKVSSCARRRHRSRAIWCHAKGKLHQGRGTGPRVCFVDGIYCLVVQPSPSTVGVASAPPDKHDAPPCLCRGRLPLRRASAQNRPGLYLAIAQTRANTSTRPRNLLHIGDFSSCFPVGRGLVDTWPVHSKTNMNYRTF